MKWRLTEALAVSSLCSILAAACSSPQEAPVAVSAQSGAITVPTGFVDETVVSGLASPTAMAFAPDGRLFVAEQRGALRVVKGGALLSTPFVSLDVDSRGERGLLGVVLDPAFATNGYVYVYYTAKTPRVHNRITRFRAAGDVAAAGSETPLLELDDLSSATNHNGGALHFGADGKLYAAVGDNAQPQNAQTLANLLGKILRLEPDGRVPTDNPFFATASGRNRAIWALGLRNPFTFAVRRADGALFVNDVGQDAWEEIDEARAGANHGWPATEGPTSDARFVAPLFAYGHGTGATTGCAIAGGAFYDPPAPTFPAAYAGAYFFADHCSGWIRALDPKTKTAAGFATGLASPVDLRVGPDGALYYLARGGGGSGSAGRVGRILASASATPRITAGPQSLTRAAGQAASFSVSASGSAPLTFQWQRDGADLPGATGATLSLPAVTMADDGARFRVVVHNAFGAATSGEARLTVTSNGAPTARIDGPAADATYAAGETIAYAGSAQDPEDGPLGAAAFTWQVDFHHDDHVHPFLPPTSGAAGGSFVVPTLGETATNVFYRIRLTVTDADGAVTSTFRDVRPRTAVLTLETSPPGLLVTLDGQPVATPAQITSVVGMTRSLGVPAAQVRDGARHDFTAWSDGGAATHAIATPAANATFRATFAASPVGLRAEYFDDLAFGTPRIVRVDPTIDFDWGSGAPDPALGADTFGVRWTGTITPRFSETYTFYTTSDDGVRLWVDGRLVVSSWTDHAAKEDRGTIALVAGRRHEIKMEYYDRSVHAVAKLAWSSPSQPRQIVPAAVLSPP